VLFDDDLAGGVRCSGGGIIKLRDAFVSKKTLGRIAKSMAIILLLEKTVSRHLTPLALLGLPKRIFDLKSSK
jgi:hypothetical protein